MIKQVLQKTKKAVAVMLAAATLTSLTACGQSETTGTPSTEEKQNTEVSTPSTEEVVESTPSSEEVEEELTHIEKVDAYFADYPAFDLGGRTIKICMFWDQYYDSNHTAPEDDPNVANVEMAQMMIDNVRRVEKKYNCRIEYVNPGSEALIQSLNTSVVAGTPDYDVYLTQTWFAFPLALNGYFYDLSEISHDYSDINNEATCISAEPLAGTNCFFEKASRDVAGRYLVYNADMLEELNLEDPNELYAKGEWTWDKFAELCKAATQDTDNNGETDIYGYGGGSGNTVTEFLASNNATLITEDGKENLSDPKVIETFTFLNRLYNEEKIARPMTEDYNADAFAWTEGKCAFSVTQLWIIQTAENLNFNYRLVPWPTGPSGDGSQAGQSFADYYVIPKGVEEPEKVLQVVEEFFGWHGGDLELRDQDMIELAESCLLEESDVNVVWETSAKGNGDIWSLVDSNYIITGIFDSVVSGTMTPAQAIEANRQVWQDAIDSVLK